MPRYSSPQRNNSGPQNDLIEKEAQADSLNNSMPALSMGNAAMQDMLLSGGPVEIPLWNGNENMSLVIGSDQKDEKIPENGQNQRLDGYDSDSSEISTSKEAMERMKKQMQNPKVELVDPKGQKKEINSESEAPKVVEDAEKKAENPEEGQPGELGQAEKDMDSIKELDFAPVRMKENKLNKEVGFKSTFMQLLGATVGKILGTVFNLGLLPFTGVIIAKDFIKSWWKRGSLQKKRDHKQIPGWDGAEYNEWENDSLSDDQVNVDFRKVPAVWSFPIAAKAAEENPAGDQNNPRKREKPLDPIVSIMVDQPKDGSSESFNGREMGHTFLGIEYSRFSKVTNRYERYMIKYGFYPGGGMQALSAGMMMISRDAVLPGQMYNDKNHVYSISRRFPAKPSQVNAILRASETYADQGYGFYTRNCTTFVKDMIQNVGHITKLAEPIFQQDAVQFPAMENAGMFAAKAFHLNAKAGVENLLMNLGDQEDLGYENFGNKRVTKQDYKNYHKSIDHDLTPQKYTEIPAMVGENLRRASGEHAGDIGAYKYSGPLKKFSDKPGDVFFSLRRIGDAVGNETEIVKATAMEILKEISPEQVSEELKTLIVKISCAGYGLLDLDSKMRAYFVKNKIQQDPQTELEAVTANDLRAARRDCDEDIARLNQLYRIFKNDARLHMPVVQAISLLNYGTRMIDEYYQNIRRGKDNPGELGDIRGDMRKDVFKVTAGGKTAVFSPTEYEAFIQVYKTPEAAVKKMARLKELSDKENSDEDLTKAEQKELDKFSLIAKTVNSFISAHDYMLEKDEFNQQDVDYAFRLQKKETEGARSDAFNAGQTSSSIYQALIYEEVFGGMKERFFSQEQFQNVTAMTPEVMDSLKRWFDNDMSECAERKDVEMTQIMHGIMKSMKNPNKDAMRDVFKDSVIKSWLQKIFNPKKKENGLEDIYFVIPFTVADILGNTGSRFRRIVDMHIDRVS